MVSMSRSNTNLVNQQLVVYENYQMMIEIAVTKEVDANFIVDGAVVICDQREKIN